MPVARGVRGFVKGGLHVIYCPRAEVDLTEVAPPRLTMVVPVKGSSEVSEVPIIPPSSFSPSMLPTF